MSALADRECDWINQAHMTMLFALAFSNVCAKVCNETCCSRRKVARKGAQRTTIECGHRNLEAIAEVAEQVFLGNPTCEMTEAAATVDWFGVRHTSG
jgi:hypothetical protein